MLRFALVLFVLLLLAANLVQSSLLNATTGDERNVSVACPSGGYACRPSDSPEYVVYLGGCQDRDLRMIREPAAEREASPTYFIWCN